MSLDRDDLTPEKRDVLATSLTVIARATQTRGCGLVTVNEVDCIAASVTFAALTLAAYTVWWPGPLTSAPGPR